ncbi:hypothetical protein GGR58DRAFT_200363 [Xylaria digitata]|nr:hypothetical protein GGR58DRAFT_200363 [Xylaria digitata]
MPSKAVLLFTGVEWEERCRLHNSFGVPLNENFGAVALDTSILLPSQSGLVHVPEHCENASKAEMLGLRSFSAFQNRQGPVYNPAKTVPANTWVRTISQMPRPRDSRIHLYNPPGHTAPNMSESYTPAPSYTHSTSATTAGDSRPSLTSLTSVES